MTSIAARLPVTNISFLGNKDTYAHKDIHYLCKAVIYFAARLPVTNIPLLAHNHFIKQSSYIQPKVALFRGQWGYIYIYIYMKGERERERERGKESTIYIDIFIYEEQETDRQEER